MSGDGFEAWHKVLREYDPRIINVNYDGCLPRYILEYIYETEEDNDGEQQKICVLNTAAPKRKESDFKFLVSFSDSCSRAFQ